MLKIGITGGIGTGKSIVCKIFELLGIPVFNADVEAKLLYTESEELKAAIKNEFGTTIYENNLFRKERLANIVFSDKNKLKRLNEIIHPLVIQKGENWFIDQKAPYALKEAALLIESETYKKVDKVILVQAPLSVRMDRIMKRDNLTQEAVQQRIDAQMPEDKKTEYAHFIIMNDEENPLIPQVLKIHKQLISLCEV